MGFPFSGNVPLAAINDLITFVEGNSPKTLPELEVDALAVFGWVTGQAFVSRTLHLLGTAPASYTKDDAVKVLKDLSAGKVGAINWQGLLLALLSMLPTLLPFLNPTPAPTPAA